MPNLDSGKLSFATLETYGKEGANFESGNTRRLPKICFQQHQLAATCSVLTQFDWLQAEDDRK
jgi:hypothetical protein